MARGLRYLALFSSGRLPARHRVLVRPDLRRGRQLAENVPRAEYAVTIACGTHSYNRSRAFKRSRRHSSVNSRKGSTASTSPMCFTMNSLASVTGCS